MKTLKVTINNPEIFQIHAEYCKTLANPIRLMILALLSKKEMSVGELAKVIDIRIATISQHLATLRSKNIVQTRKEKQTVYYSLVDTRLTEACRMIRTVLLEDMKRQGKIAKDMSVEGAITIE